MHPVALTQLVVHSRAFRRRRILRRRLRLAF
jgi:hypothetical protein